MTDVERINKITQLDQSGDIDSAIDEIIDLFDNLFRGGAFNKADELFLLFPLQSLSTSVLVNLLCVSYWAKEHLPHRDDMKEAIRAILTIREPARVDRLLQER